MKNKILKIFDNISNNTGLIFLFILQIAFIFTIIYYLLVIHINFLDKKDIIKEKLGDYNLYYIQNNEEYPIKLYKKDSIDDYTKFYEFLKNNYTMINCTSNTLSIVSTFLPDELKKNSLKNEKYNDNILSLFKAYWINENFLEQFDLKTEFGDFWNENEFEKKDDILNSVPIVAGSFFKSFFNLGDEVEFKDYTYNGILRKMKIIGFLEKDQGFPNKPIMFSNIQSLDKTILFPNKSLDIKKIVKLNKEKEGINIINTITYKNIVESFIKLTNKESVNEIKDMASNMNFFDIELIGAKESISKFENYYYPEFKIRINIVILLIICSVMTITSYILTQIDNRKRELGIHYAIGATSSHLCISILMEYYIYFITGCISSIMFLSILKKMNYITKINIKIYIMTWIIMILIILIVSLILNKRLKKINFSLWLKEDM